MAIESEIGTQGGKEGVSAVGFSSKEEAAANDKRTQVEEWLLRTKSEEEKMRRRHNDIVNRSFGNSKVWESEVEVQREKVVPVAEQQKKPVVVEQEKRNWKEMLKFSDCMR
jgi:hypothetical protein